MTIVWHPSTARESIRRCPLSYSTRSTLMTHTDRSSCAASSQTHLSGLQRKRHVGTLLCVAKSAVCRGLFSCLWVFHNMRNWRATRKRYLGVVGGANAQTQSHWPMLTYRRPCFDFSESVRANADNLINIHEPSSWIILSAFYMVINSRIRGMLSVLFVGFPLLFYWNTKWQTIS